MNSIQIRLLVVMLTQALALATIYYGGSAFARGPAANSGSYAMVFPNWGI